MLTLKHEICMAQKVPYALAALLVFWILSRVFIAAHEYPMRPEQVLTMAHDAAASKRIFGT
jgi:hypothetical protein